MKFLPSKEQIANWCIGSAWTLGIATVMTQGVITPLTLIIAGTLFGIEAKGNYPVAQIARSAMDKYLDFKDGNFQPELELTRESNLVEYYKTYGATNRHEKPSNDGLAEELAQTSVCSFRTSQGRFPWSKTTEQAVKYSNLPVLDKEEIARIPERITRSGCPF
jgi:hypothetical protein